MGEYDSKCGVCNITIPILEAQYTRWEGGKTTTSYHMACGKEAKNLEPCLGCGLHRAVCDKCEEAEDKKMNEMTLKALLAQGKSYFAECEADYLVVWVTGNATQPEMIVNSVENFKEKLDYYAKAYNEDLTLKANPKISIKHYAFLTKEELAAHL